MTGILWGAMAAHLLIVSLGLLILLPLRLRLTVPERWAAAAACGLPAAVVLVHALSAAGLFRRGVIQLLVALAALASAYLHCRLRAAGPGAGVSEARAPASALAWLPVLFMWLWVAIAATGPDHTPPAEDAPLVSAHRVASGFEPAPWNIGAAWALPYAIGRHSAVALFHASLLLPGAAALSRFGWLAMLLLAAHPALIALGSRSGSAVAFSLAVFVATGALTIALVRKEWRLAAIAILAAIAAILSWPGPLEIFSGFVFLKSPWWLAPFLAAGAGWLVTPIRPAAAALAVFAILTGLPPLTAILAPARPQATELQGMVEARFLDLLPRAATVLSDIPMPGAWIPRRLAPHPEWLEEARRVAAAQWGIRKLPFPASRIVELRPPGFTGEVTLRSGGRDIPRDPKWKVWPPEAFDGLPFTGSTGPIRIDTGSPLAAGEASIIGTEGDAWSPSDGLRRNVVLDWKRRGITHVLVRDPQLVEEFDNHPAFWGVEPLGQRNEAKLYALR